jgi:hypothetical protein
MAVKSVKIQEKFYLANYHFLTIFTIVKYLNYLQLFHIILTNVRKTQVTIYLIKEVFFSPPPPLFL